MAALSGAPGYTSLALRLRDTRRAAAERTVAAVRDELRATTAFTAFDDLPAIREPGGYPGKENFERLASVLNVITLLALLSALVLVSNTMTTLIGEQTGEIAAMKAIGARRRDIRRLYLRTALLLGAIGALIAGRRSASCSRTCSSASSRRCSTSTPASACRVPILARQPRARRSSDRRWRRCRRSGARRACRFSEALQATGSAVGGQGRLDGLLRRVRFLPRSAQIGLRGVARRQRRTIATVVQIALAVATLLALLSLGAGVATTTRGWFDDNHFDVWVQTVASKPFDADAATTDRLHRGRARGAGLDAEHRARRGPGRPGLGPPGPAADEHAHGPRALVHRRRGRRRGAASRCSGGRSPRPPARTSATAISVSTSGGPATLRVIGISGNQADNGGVVFMPLATLQPVLGSPGRGQQLLDHDDVPPTTR